MLTIQDRDRMNLLGLMLGGVVASNLASTKGAALASRLSGALGITAGKMTITVKFAGDEVTVSRGLQAGLKSHVRGSLNSLLQISLGRSPVGAFLAGDISFTGSLFFLLKLVPLLRPPIAEKSNTP
jgi:hypothetical protein